MDELAILPLLASKIKIREDTSNTKKKDSSEDFNDDEEELSSDEEGDSCEFYKFFPQFNWVVRDLSMDF